MDANKIKELFKECLYSKNKDIREATTIGVAVAVATSCHSVFGINRRVDELAKWYMVDSAKLKAYARKHADFINSFKSLEPHFAITSFGDVVGYSKFYTEEDIKFINNNIKYFNIGYQAASLPQESPVNMVV